MFKCECGHESKTAKIVTQERSSGIATHDGKGWYEWEATNTEVHESTLYCEGCDEPLTDY